MTLKSTKNSIVQVEDFKAIWRVFAKNWYIFTFFLFLSFLLYKWYNYSRTTPYTVKAKLLLKYDNPSDGPKLTQGIAYTSYVDYSNETSVVRSYELVEKTIEKLKLDVSYFIKGRFKNLEIFQALPFEVFVFTANPAVYDQDIKFIIRDESQFELTYRMGETDVIKRFYFDKPIIDNDFKIEVKKSYLVNQSTIQRQKEIEYVIRLHSKSALTSKYLGALSVDIPAYSAIMNLSLNDVIPQRAIMFLDTLSNVYVENTLKSQIEVNDKTLVYIEKQLREANSFLNNIEGDIVNYKETKGIMDLPKQEQRIFEQLTGYETDKKKLDLQLNSLDALEKYIIEDKDPELLPPSFYIASEDAFLKSSVAELYQFQMNRKGELINATEKNISVAMLDKKIEYLKSNLLTYIGNTRDALKGKIAELGVKIEKIDALINDIPKKQRDIVNMQRQLQVNEKMSMFLMERKANMIISRAGFTSGTKIIEKAHSVGKVKSPIPNVELAFFGGGLIISLIIAFVRSYVFEKMDSIEQLKQNTSLPILGEINYVGSLKGQSNLLVGPKTKSLITESFRVVRTNLQYTPTEGIKKAKVVLVTSHRPGEGKTFCSVNLGAILARAGKRVLIVELDLHKPSIENAFGWFAVADKGASNVLNGDTPIEDAILKDVVPKMDIILSGEASESASELLLSDNMHDLVEYGKANYDYVILDTPPVGLLSDALVLMPFADVSIYILNAKFRSGESIKQAHEIFENNKPQNLCFILNGVKIKKLRYTGYSYYGGYGTYANNNA